MGRINDESTVRGVRDSNGDVLASTSCVQMQWYVWIIFSVDIFACWCKEKKRMQELRISHRHVTRQGSSCVTLSRLIASSQFRMNSSTSRYLSVSIDFLAFLANMPTTRSQTKQSHIDDFVQHDEPENIQDSKRKQSADPSGKTSPSKRQKKTQSPGPAKKSMSKQNAALMQGKDKNASDDDGASDTDPSTSFTINRAPVLELWAACVAHFLYPSLAWKTCLSAGSAVSSICAVSKGRSIGVIESKDNEKQKPKNERPDRLEEIDLMGFHLKLKDELVVVGNSTKPANEDTLKKKFGEADYLKVKECFETALDDCKGIKNELNEKAFGFYEKFRPDIPKGQKGWGRKGGLRLTSIQDIVGRSKDA